MHPLRSYLRDATRAHHDRVDAAFSRFDLSEKSGCIQFLNAHYAAYMATKGVATDLPFAFDAMSIVDDLQTDLTNFDAMPPMERSLSTEAHPHPIGWAYVVGGASLGLRSLTNTYSCLAETRFLSGRSAQALWKHVMSWMDEGDVPRNRYDDIRVGAALTFQIYEKAAIRIATNVSGDPTQ